MSAQVHILGPQFSTFVRSVCLACEEKGISYRYGLKPGGEEIEFKGPSHLALHPFGKIPALLHDEHVIFETTAICRYLDAAFPGPALQPEDPVERAYVDEWSAALSCYVDQALVRNYLLEFAFPKGEDGSIRMDKVAEHQPAVIDMLGLLEHQLAGKPFICGEQYSMADTILTPMLDYLSGLPHADELLAATPELKAWTERMQARDSGKQVLISRS
ncbi:glutathione S-transferase family protein [Aliamphritea spongicola]|uniref:glutathione S-transferase family protein n=1 Tax=Aliamphritea spongicola TaxID=707589 RepID=UPI00196A3FF9|nr:glutathione S-transferase family protein [Aliamphritea spongicola]MBN3560969.1 glutathione S-transferase family protein [Aliamphritea spongicola]